MLRCPCMHAHRASLRRLQLSWSCTGSGHSTSDAHQTSFQRTRWCILRKQHNAANRVNRKVTAENLTTTDQVSFTKYRKDATPRKGNDVKSSKENTVAELPSTVTGLEQFLKLDRVTVVKCIKDYTGEETIPKDFVIDKELVKRIIKHFGRETELPSDPKPPPRSDILSKKKVEPIETPVETSVTTSPEMTDYLTRLKNIGKEVTVLRFPIANMLTVTKQSTESIRNTESLNKNIDDRMAKERTLSMKQNFIARQNMKEDLIARQNMKEDLIARQDMKEDLLARQTTKEDLISRQNMKEDLIAKQTMKEDLIARQNMKDDLISRQNMKGDLIARQTMKEDLIAMQTRKEDMVARLAKFRQGTSSVYGSQALVTMPQSTAELCARLGVGKEEVLRQVQEITGQTFKEDEIMADKVLLTRLLSRTANHTGVNWKPRVKAYTPETMGKVKVETISSNKIESHQTFIHKEQLIFENKTNTASEVASKTVNRSEQLAGHEKSELGKKSIKTELPIAGKMMADISSEKKLTPVGGSSTGSDQKARVKSILELTDTEPDKTAKVDDMKSTSVSSDIKKVSEFQNVKDEEVKMAKSSAVETPKQAASSINTSLTATAEPIKLTEEVRSGESNRVKKKRESQKEYRRNQIEEKKVMEKTDSLKSLFKSFQKAVITNEDQKPRTSAAFDIDSLVTDTELVNSRSAKTGPEADKTLNGMFEETASERTDLLLSDASKTLNDTSKEHGHKPKLSQVLKNMLNKTVKESDRDNVMSKSNENAETLDSKLKSLKNYTSTSNFVSKSTDFQIESIFKTDDSKQNVHDFKIDSIFNTENKIKNKTDDSEQNVLAKSFHITENTALDFNETPAFDVKENPAFELDELKDTFNKLKVLKSMTAPKPINFNLGGNKTLKDLVNEPLNIEKRLEQDYGKKVTQSNKIASTVISPGKKNDEQKTELATGPVFVHKIASTVISPGKKSDEQKTELATSPVFVPRPPVVTIMGHVDHGKTTLLDALRNSRVVDTEFGGITQHIGAFNVQLISGQSITFLDTPGHAAFSAMRSRGASVTDIIVLVIAAEDGVMPQTIESIQLAQAANVPLIVAINKIDRPNTNVESLKNLLSQYGVLCEEHGGDVQVVPISALKGINLDKLQECIVSLAEYLELKGDVSSLVEARIIETRTDVGRGKMATMVINKGVLRKGDYLLSGTTYTKVRTLFDCNGAQILEAGPGIPVEIGGWKEMPQTGDPVQQFATEKQLKQALQENEELQKKEVEAKALEESTKKAAGDRETYLQIRDKRREEYIRHWHWKSILKVENEILEQKQMTMEVDNRPVIRIIIKGDVSGSVEAIVDTLATFTSDICDLDIVHHGVGNVTEMDLQMASAFNADIYAFQLDPGACKSDSKVTTRHYNVIYHLFAQLVEHINAQLPQIEKEEIIGEAVVQQSFEITVKKDKVQIAGCRCQSGSLIRSKRFRLIRGEEVLYDGTLSSMKHHKLEVNVIKTDQDCGLCLDSGLVSQPGDIIVCYDMVKVKQTLDWKPGFDLKTDDISM